VSPLTQIKTPGLDLEAIRKKLEDAKGPEYWNSLEQLASTTEFRQFVEDEFPIREMDWADPAKRRTFLKLMGASLALAGLGACTKQPPEEIVPYVVQPEEFVPGKPLFYATAMPAQGGANGILVESHLGRPTKIEGNPNHPSSLGATDAFTQASILDLYEPDRSQVVIRNGNISSWVNFQAVLVGLSDQYSAKQGAGLRLLTAPIISPTLASQMQDFLRAFPQAKWHQWDPVRRPMGHNIVYNFDNADVILSLDADFLACGPGNPRYAHEFSKKRRLMVPETPVQQKEALQRAPTEDRPEGKASNYTYASQSVPGKSTMNRLYMAEATVTNTGGMADHRIRMRASDIEGFAREVAAGIGAGGGTGSPESAKKFIPAIVKDLQAHRGSSLVIAGEYQPASVHALAHAMNQALGNVGKTVNYTPPVEFNPVDPFQSLKQLVDDMNGGQVETLLIFGVNPVYDGPADFGFTEALKKVKLRAHLGLHSDETAGLCHWHIPEAHYLETWSDARAHDGTVTIMQPLILPMYGGRTAHQILYMLVNKADLAVYDIVREYWQRQSGSTNFNVFWQQSLNDGVVANSAFTPGATPTFPAAAASTQAQASGGLEIVFRPDPAVWDGRYSNNAWLQEMPKPQNKMTWDNAVWISPYTAEKLKVTSEDEVEITYRGRKTRGPIWVMPSHADDSITVHFGYGRTRGGHNAEGVGFDVYGLRTSDAPWFGTGAEIKKLGTKHGFATTQYTYTMEGRAPVKTMQYEEYLKNPRIEQEEVPRELTLYPEFKYTGYKWGMSIDLNACTGCQACVIACQAENNVAVVGKDQVLRGRHMHWLRVDRYFRGKLDDPELYFQPLPCMQCEDAPCELVCPVAATVHSGDGLNQMVYNRCVGTRYCSNNCPYKVRRFNFYRFSDWYTESLFGLRNPDVTVRSRGVMEKCTYCVQRIAEAKIESEKEDRRIRDGEVITACAQACPTQAIVFGDINEPNSVVARFKAQPRNYSLLEDLNTRPRTTYLARVRNPNPDIERG
jgi:MoCo/4Fe-4S cofactor protein with predicted Tat translocation signal